MLEILGKKIKSARLTKGLTQSQVADMIGISRTLVSSIELGHHNSRINTLAEIAKVLGITLEIPPRGEFDG